MNIHAGTVLLAGLYVVAAEVSLPAATAPSDDDTVVMQVTLAGNPYRTWGKADIPIGTPHHLASLVEGPGAVTVQVKDGVHATNYRVVRVDVP